MKKFTKAISLALALVLSVMALASCALFAPKPATDPAEAKKALKENGYTVYFKDAMLDKGQEAYLYAYIDGSEHIVITWYDNTIDAKEAYKELKENLSEMKKDLKDIKDDIPEKDYKEYKRLTAEVTSISPLRLLSCIK